MLVVCSAEQGSVECCCFWAKYLESKPSNINNIYLQRETNNSSFSGLFILSSHAGEVL